MTHPAKNIYEGEETQGPGWLLFFTETVRTMPAYGGSGYTDGSHKDPEDLIIEELINSDDQDISDIITIVALSGFLDR